MPDQDPSTEETPSGDVAAQLVQLKGKIEASETLIKALTDRIAVSEIAIKALARYIGGADARLKSDLSNVVYKVVGTQNILGPKAEALLREAFDVN